MLRVETQHFAHRSIFRRVRRIVKQLLLAATSVRPSAWHIWAHNERILMKFNGGLILGGGGEICRENPCFIKI